MQDVKILKASFYFFYHNALGYPISSAIQKSLNSMRTYNFDTIFNHLKWAIKDKLHFEILITVMWVSKLFRNISYSDQTTNNETKTEKNA